LPERLKGGEVVEVGGGLFVLNLMASLNKKSIRRFISMLKLNGFVNKDIKHN
jgi:hypothetical protein